MFKFVKGFCVVTVFFIISSICSGEIITKLDIKDFSFNKFGYNCDRQDIEKIIGEPTENSLPNCYVYSHFNSYIVILYRNNKAVSIFVGDSKTFLTNRGIKIGDNYNKIISEYGKPDKMDLNKGYLEYVLPNSENENLNLLLGFSIKNEVVQNITIGDYQACNLFY